MRWVLLAAYAVLILGGMGTFALQADPVSRAVLTWVGNGG